jgi:iron(III) transport system ATP-binding protein
MQSVILHLENVTRQFSRTTAPAVNNLSLTLHQGDLLGLLGPSGCGKTTLLRLIAGFERPQTGAIALAGQTVAGSGRWVPPERRDVGMVFQDYALFPHLTVANNVAFGLRIRKYRRYSAQQIQDLTAEVLALVGLDGLQHRYPHELSGGQQQRVALARALAPQPDLILLDEPLSNLDVQVRLRLRQEVRDILKKTGTSAVFVTHDQEEALSMSDWVAVMRQGQLEQFGTPESIYREPASRFVAEFVTQANFLPAWQNGNGWETEIGYFEIQATGAGNKGKANEQGSQESKGLISQAQQELNPLKGVRNQEDTRTQSYRDTWAMTVPPSVSCPVPAPTAELMLRPEDLILEPDAAGMLVVRDRQFLGREYRYCLVTPSGREVHVRNTAETLIPVGTHVKLGAIEADFQLFPI